MQRRLYRSTTDKYIGGVCGGLAEYFNVDPALVRIIFALMLFASGFGLLAYIVLWIAVRHRPASEPIQPETQVRPVWGRYLPGALLIFLGLIFLVHENWRWFDLDFYFERFWPLLLVGLGLLLVLYHGNGHEKSKPDGLPPSPAHPHNGGAVL
jgi:phage shock protein C